MRIPVLSVLLVLAAGHLMAQQYVTPVPGGDILMAATDQWMVWNRVHHLDVEHPGRGGVISTAFYLQRIGDKRARLVYRDTVGMIQPFVPIWVWNDGTIIGWDGVFQTIAGRQIRHGDVLSLPGSTYYPVLCGAMKKGVLMLTQNDQRSSDACERLYYVPWSADQRIVDLSKAVMISDSTGIPFFWPSVRWSGDVILAWRAPVIFRYDAGPGVADSVRFTLPETGAAPSQMLAFDGRSVVVDHGGTRWACTLDKGEVRSLSLPSDFSVVAIHGAYIYGVLGAALTKSDTLSYLLQAFQYEKHQWKTLLELAGDDILQEEGLPLVLERKEGLTVWSGGRWYEIPWLK